MVLAAAGLSLNRIRNDMRIDLGNVSLNVVDRGGGSPVLLVHGFPLDHSMWQGQITMLSKEHRVIAPDLRGFGSSGVTEGTVTMEQFADDLNDLLDALKISEPVAFCGLSMGGYIGWQFFRRHRQRVSTLILCDTKAAADTSEAAENRHKLADRVLQEGAGVVADAMLPKLFAKATHERQPQMVAATQQVMLRTDPQGIAAALRGMAARPDSTGLLGDVDVPTLVIVGQEDAISPPDEMRSMAAAIPQAQFIDVPSAGHMAPLENAAAVSGAIERFLASEERRRDEANAAGQ
jgi:3-oxoadipate enol-lactonase